MKPFIPEQFSPPPQPETPEGVLPPLDQLGIDFAKAMVRNHHQVSKAAKEIKITTPAGHKLAQSPAVQAYIDQLQEEQDHRTKITDDYILYKLQDVVENSTEIAPLMVKKRDENDKIYYEKEEGHQMVDAGAACRALELLGKNRKMFVDRVEKETKSDVYVHAPARPSLSEWQAAANVTDISAGEIEPPEEEEALPAANYEEEVLEKEEVLPGEEPIAVIGDTDIGLEF